MYYFPVKINQINNHDRNLNRTAYGLSLFNATHFVIFGGYDQAEGKVVSLNMSDMIEMVTIQYQNKENEIVLSPLAKPVGELYGLFGLGFFLIVAFILYYKKFHAMSQLEKKFEIHKMGAQNNPVVNTISIDDERTTNSTDLPTTLVITTPNDNIAIKNQSDEINTVTLATKGINLAIPGYKKYIFGTDFIPQKEIGSGSFGNVCTGLILNENLAHTYNNDIYFCAIKIFKLDDTELFFQELSIHEVFRENKCFSKLICYSESPKAVVFKFYCYGSLSDFIFMG